MIRKSMFTAIVAALVGVAALLAASVAYADDGEAEPIPLLADGLDESGANLCPAIAAQYVLLVAAFGGSDTPDMSTSAGGLTLKNLVIDHHIEMFEESFGHNLTAADEAAVATFLNDHCLAAAAPPPTTAISTTTPPTTMPPTTTLPGYDLTTPSTCEVGEVLQRGDTGDAVRCLQLRLDQITPGSDVTIDGVFGDDTDNQVRLFQTLNDMTVDGIVGAQTAGVLGIWNPTEPPPPEVQPAVAQTNVYYQNCDAVRAAGADPIHRGDPGYRSALDRDGDGVGCE